MIESSYRKGSTQLTYSILVTARIDPTPLCMRLICHDGIPRKAATEEEAPPMDGYYN